MTAKAAYAGGLRIKDHRVGRVHDYTARQATVISCAILLPRGITGPTDPEQLWNAAERAEKRGDSWVGREAVLSLYPELPEAKNQSLLEGYGQYLADSHGIAAQANLHRYGAGDKRNVHGHIPLSGRVISNAGFGPKLRSWDQNHTSGAILEELRRTWAEHVNRALRDAGITKTVDHRSYQRQGFSIVPTAPLGKRGHALTQERRARLAKFVKAVTYETLEEITKLVFEWSESGDMTLLSKSVYRCVFVDAVSTPQLDPLFVDLMQKRIARLIKASRATSDTTGILMAFQDLQQTVEAFPESEREPLSKKKTLERFA